MTILIFGLGPLGLTIARKFKKEGLPIIATSRCSAKRVKLSQEFDQAIDPSQIDFNSELLKNIKGLIITAAPDSAGCPAFLTFAASLKNANHSPHLWIAYASSTSIYGDAKGSWVDEDTRPVPLSEEGKNRLKAEQQWLSISDHHTLQIFRLPGLYGIERNAFLRILDEKAQLISNRDQVFGRLHHDDGALGFWAGYKRPISGIYNLCDDWPSSPNDPLLYAAKLLKKNLPLADDNRLLSPKAARFYAENKRVSNTRAKSVLGWHLKYPSYKEGLDSLFNTITDVQ